MSYVRAELRFKNAQMAIAMEKLGFTQQMLADLVGLSNPVINSYLNLRAIPTIKNRRKISAILEVDSHKLFDQYVKVVELKKRKILLPKYIKDIDEKTFSELGNKETLKQIPSNLASDSLTTLTDLNIDINRVLSTLTDKEKKVIKMFYGIDCINMDLDEIAESLDLTREKVKQIKEKAIRRTKHTARSNVLREYL